MWSSRVRRCERRKDAGREQTRATVDVENEGSKGEIAQAKEAGGGKADKEEGGRKKEDARVSGVEERKVKGGKPLERGEEQGRGTETRGGWARVGVGRLGVDAGGVRSITSYLDREAQPSLVSYGTSRQRGFWPGFRNGFSAIWTFGQ
jgi:hypothetical protein